MEQHSGGFMKSLITAQTIERKIYLIRGQKVMLDSDLAELYEVPTKVLVQAVKRNANRFPVDFMFPLTNQEVVGLRSQFVTSKPGRGGRGSGSSTIPAPMRSNHAAR